MLGVVRTSNTNAVRKTANNDYRQDRLEQKSDESKKTIKKMELKNLLETWQNV